ncbi:hypothetical protein DINM_022188 [Dirofilaria immitis]|nr:hypothetical protein [Dirofilaria immitis]
MRSWKTALLRRTCAMFGNRCYFLLHHHRLFPMELVSLIPATMIILITVIIGTRVDAIRFADPFPSPFSSVISSGRYGPEAILARIRMRRNASKFPFSSHAIIRDNQQQALRKKLKSLQQAQNIVLTDSPPVQILPKLIPSNFSILTNRQDCNGSDCLKNNDAVSLYIPRENSTNDGQLPPLLLLSNNPSSSGNNWENRNLQQSTTLKLPKLHTGIKILEPDVQQLQKSIPLHPADVPHHISQANSRNYNEYSNVKISEIGPIPPTPPFAGGAELTDFIQPIDTTVQTHRIYGNVIPSATNHISPAAYSNKNKHYLLSSSGNRGIYGNFPSEPLLPFSSELGIYELGTSSSPPFVYSTYSAQNTDYFTSSPYYRSQYDLYSVNFNFD